MLGSHLVLVTLSRGLQLVLSKTLRIDDTSYPYLVYLSILTNYKLQNEVGQRFDHVFVYFLLEVMDFKT